ncbi:endonuclease domain-containing protein [Acinetobacter guillouiae]|uniref:endonuclease domain-containing protein n=1 Tax=Acinetobacter guillouiae TaxID=106649 RepID=UPI001CD7306F|nr:endonuclease domain-containing protein [Acinetobacter guillouiae]
MESISIADYQKHYGGRTKKKSNSKRSIRVKTHQGESIGESTLANQLRVLKISFEQEYKFDPKRKWRADFHIMGKKILIEVEGGIWSGGRHTRGKGYIGDMEKYNAAVVMGYQVLRFSTQQVKSGLAVQQIEMMVGDL